MFKPADLTQITDNSEISDVDGITKHQVMCLNNLMLHVFISRQLKEEQIIVISSVLAP